jgi:hypothetical protein
LGKRGEQVEPQGTERNQQMKTGVEEEYCPDREGAAMGDAFSGIREPDGCVVFAYLEPLPIRMAA